MAERITTITVEEIRANEDNDQTSVGRDKKVKSTQPSYWNLLHLATIEGTSILFLLPSLWIPRHNSIYYPDFWYEIIILIAPTASFTGTAMSMLECVIFTKQKSLLKISVVLKMFGCYFVSTIGTLLLSYVLWTLVMQFQHPMPLVGIATYFAIWFTLLCTLWSGFLFPLELRMNNGFRSKIKTYLKYEIWWFIMTLQTDFLTFGFEVITGYPQILFAILIPTVKALNGKVLMKLVSEMVGKDDEMATILMGVRLNIHFALFVAIRMNGAENLTIASVIIVDLVLQLKMAYEIIQLNNQVSNSEERQITHPKKEKVVLKLLLAELVEGLVPMIYAIVFAMAYYGPNGLIMGNILSDTWQYQKVEDAARLFVIQALFFGLDLVCVAANTFLVFKFGNVDLIMHFCQLLKDYWFMVTVLIMHPVSVLFIMNDINVAMDMTMKFEWITEEGRIKFIQNATDLNDNEKKMLLENITFT